MHINGSCHCGFITYEAEVDPSTATLCHCTDCQVTSGSAFRATVPATKENFHLLTGEPAIYIKTADSGNKRAQAFCPRCGTHIYAAAPVDPQQFGLRLGPVRQRADITPARQIWCNSALPWSMHLEAITAKAPGQT